MPTVCLFGTGLAGKTTTLQQFARSRPFHLTSQATESDRFLFATLASLRFVTVPGAVWSSATHLYPLLESEVVVCVVDVQPEVHDLTRELFTGFLGEVRLAPRVYQLNKADLGPTGPAREMLPDLGWTSGIPVFETIALRSEGMDALFDGVLALLDDHGPGPGVRAAVTDAFPGRAPEILTELERRCLGWGVRRLVRCPCDGVAVVRIGPAGAIDVARSRNHVPPVRELPAQAATRLSRDALLAELGRVLDDADLSRVERACGRDVEDRDAECPRCGRPLAVRASFDGARWRVERRG